MLRKALSQEITSWWLWWEKSVCFWIIAAILNDIFCRYRTVWSLSVMKLDFYWGPNRTVRTMPAANCAHAQLDVNPRMNWFFCLLSLMYAGLENFGFELLSECLAFSLSLSKINSVVSRQAQNLSQCNISKHCARLDSALWGNSWNACYLWKEETERDRVREREQKKYFFITPGTRSNLVVLMRGRSLASGRKELTKERALNPSHYNLA